jgi:hypothetical protein
MCAADWEKPDEETLQGLPGSTTGSSSADTQLKPVQHTFSKVLSIVALRSNYTRALTFQNVADTQLKPVAGGSLKSLLKSQSLC